MGAHLLPGEIKFDLRKLWFSLPRLPWQSNCESMIVWNEVWKEDGWKKTECRIHLILNTIHANSKNIKRQFSIFLEVGCLILAVLSVLQMTLTLGWPAGYSEMVQEFCALSSWLRPFLKEREKKNLFQKKNENKHKEWQDDGCSKLDFLLVMSYTPTAVPYITKVPKKILSPI